MIEDTPLPFDPPTVRRDQIPDLTVIVPTINSGAYIDLVLSCYAQELVVPVTVFVDNKSEDDTLNVAMTHADRAVVIRNEHTRVGEIIEAMSRQCTTPWVLRIDDDELPSVAMMDFVRDAIRTDAVDAYCFPRYECAVSPDGNLLRHTSFNPAAHKQWRLYRADRVRYRTTGHTPGFYLEGLALADNTPPEAAMIHLDWAVHSIERRKSKIERYDAHTPNDGTKWRFQFLYEEEPCHASRFRRLYLREFDRIAGTLARRFPSLAVDPLSYNLGDTINFPGDSASNYLGRGWSHPEDWGRWANGGPAELRLALAAPPETDLTLTVCAKAFFGSGMGQQVVAVSANSELIGQWTFNDWSVGDRSLLIPNAVARRERILTLRFKIASPVAPRDIGISGDPRSLGFGLIAAKIMPA